MKKCEDPNWSKEVFESVSRTRSNFKGPKSGDVPQRFRGNGIVPGREDFLVWASLPQITYSADPNSLYNMNRLGKKLAENDCFAKSKVEAQAAMGVAYPKTFYFGLVAMGSAVLYTLLRKR